MKKKGLTLRKVIALIAILVIILLIAVPKVLLIINASTQVLSTLEASRDASLKSSAQMTWAEAETCVIKNEVDTSLCTLPARNETKGVREGFRSPEIIAPKPLTAWITLPKMSQFSGQYIVTFTDNTTDVASVQISNGVIASDRNCTITSKTGDCTFTN